MNKMPIETRDRNLSDALAATNLVFQKPPCSVSALSSIATYGEEHILDEFPVALNQ